MSRSQLVAETLPLLRPLCPCVDGNQASGRCICRGLSRPCFQDPSLLDGVTDTRAGLFRLIYPDLELGIAQRRSRCHDAADAAGAQAFEYHAAAGQGLPAVVARSFSEEEVAFILSIDVAETASSPIPPGARWRPRSPPTC